MRLHVFRARGAGIAELAAQDQEWRVVHDELLRGALFLQARQGGVGSGGGEQRRREVLRRIFTAFYFWLA